MGSVSTSPGSVVMVVGFLMSVATSEGSVGSLATAVGSLPWPPGP